MRIVIAGPPKTGNVWLKRMLASAYGLRLLDVGEFPARADLAAVTDWLAAGGFPDNSIFHQHYDYSPALADTFDAVPARIVTIVRNPYDTFVSAYHHQQKNGDEGARGGRRSDSILGKPLDSPEMYDYLRAGGFRRNMIRARDWIRSGRSLIVRYEDLIEDPVNALARLTGSIKPVPEARLAAAVEQNSADNLRKMGGDIAKHVRVAKVGDSREKLTERHLAIFRTLHGSLIPELGYEVR